MSVVYRVATGARGLEGLADAVEHYRWLVLTLSRRVRGEVSRIEVELALGRDAIRDLAETRVALEDCAVSIIRSRAIFVQDARAWISYLELRARPCMSFSDFQAARHTSVVEEF